MTLLGKKKNLGRYDRQGSGQEVLGLCCPGVVSVYLYEVDMEKVPTHRGEGCVRTVWEAHGRKTRKVWPSMRRGRGERGCVQGHLAALLCCLDSGPLTSRALRSLSSVLSHLVYTQVLQHPQGMPTRCTAWSPLCSDGFLYSIIIETESYTAQAGLKLLVLLSRKFTGLCFHVWPVYLFCLFF